MRVADRIPNLNFVRLISFLIGLLYAVSFRPHPIDVVKIPVVTVSLFLQLFPEPIAGLACKCELVIVTRSRIASNLTVFVFFSWNGPSCCLFVYLRSTGLFVCLH